MVKYFSSAKYAHCTTKELAERPKSINGPRAFLLVGPGKVSKNTSDVMFIRKLCHTTIKMLNEESNGYHYRIVLDRVKKQECRRQITDYKCNSELVLYGDGTSVYSVSL